MDGVSARERVAIVFMTMSVIATLILGAALTVQLGRPVRDAVQAGTTPATAPDGSAASVGGESPAGAGGEAAGPANDVTTNPSANAAGRTTGSGSRLSTGAATGTTRSGPAAVRSGATPGPAADPVRAAASASAPDKGPDNPEEGVTSDLITVGGIYDETGPIDATVHRDTVRAYFNQVNAAGGVKGRKLRLLDCDSAWDPARAHQCSQRLLSQKILGMVGWVTASGEVPETAFLTKSGVPMVGGLSVPAAFDSPLAFPTMASLTLHGTATGRRAKDLNLRSPGVLVLNLAPVGPFKDALLKALHDEGIKEVGVEEVDAAKADYTDVIVKFRAQGAKSLVLGLDPFSSARMFQAMERQNFKVPVLGPNLDKPAASDAYGPAADGTESLVSLKEAFDPAHASDADVVEYLSAVKRYFPNQMKALDVFTEAQWVAAKVFVEALRRIPGQITRQSLVAALNGLEDFQPGLVSSITYRPGDHESNRCFQWIRYDRGTWRSYSGWKCL